MQFTVFTANCVGKRSNCSYPKRVTVTDEKSLQAAVAYDHVCAEYQGNYESTVGLDPIKGKCEPRNLNSNRSRRYR